MVEELKHTRHFTKKDYKVGTKLWWPGLTIYRIHSIDSKGNCVLSYNDGCNFTKGIITCYGLVEQTQVIIETWKERFGG